MEKINLKELSKEYVVHNTPYLCLISSQDGFEAGFRKALNLAIDHMTTAIEEGRLMREELNELRKILESSK